MDGRPTWTDCDEAGDYVVPNLLSPRDLVFRPDNMDETVPHTHENHYANKRKKSRSLLVHELNKFAKPHRSSRYPGSRGIIVVPTTQVLVV